MRPTLKEIFDVTLDEMNICKEAYQRAGKSREARMVRVRRTVCYIGRYFGYTLQDIAAFLDIKHSSVYYHAEVAKDSIFYEKGYENRVNNILAYFDNTQKLSETRGWLARDEDGSLNFFQSEPVLYNGIWMSNKGAQRLQDNQFPQITLDSRPAPCEIIIKLR